MREVRRVIAAFYAAHSKLIDQIGVNALLALSLSISLKAGQLALAQAAFMGIGAYVSALIAISAGWPLWAATLLGMLAAAVIATLLALPVGRLRGVFLAIATIGFTEIVRIIAVNLKVTGGAEGLSGIPNDANTLAIYLALASAGIALWRLGGTKPALAMAATREDEHAARGVGIDTAAVRFWTLVAGAAVAASAGSLYAHANFFITPGDFGFPRMEQILVYCVIGGATNALGAVLGAAIITALPEWARFLQSYREVTDGVILLAIVLFAPRGIAGLWEWRR